MIKMFWKLFFFSGLLLISCKKETDNPEVKITKQNSGYGYQILKKQKILINQPYIPAIQTNKTFKNEIEANNVANLVIQKMKKYSLPTVSIHELDSMKIEY